ncbi:MAG: peptidoglycan recognition family protein [Nanoarchaeota archaeon]
MNNNNKLEEIEFLGLRMLKPDYSLRLDRLEENKEPYNKAIIHHSGSKDHTFEELVSLHLDRERMGAVGYHFVIDQEGNIYYTRDLKFKGAHAYPNTGKVGIGFLSSFDLKEPNKYEREALEY